ncbi:MAG: hypothetical protein QME49_09695 [bacterium]|nr:hypothetical protein [bacterium]
MKEIIRYPIPYQSKWFDKLVIKLGFWFPIYCPICGGFWGMVICHEPLRETCFCVKCRAYNRKRQIAYVICNVFSKREGKRYTNLQQFKKNDTLKVYNLETFGDIWCLA